MLRGRLERLHSLPFSRAYPSAHVVQRLPRLPGRQAAQLETLHFSRQERLSTAR